MTTRVYDVLKNLLSKMWITIKSTNYRRFLDDKHPWFLKSLKLAEGTSTSFGDIVVCREGETILTSTIELPSNTTKTLFTINNISAGLYWVSLGYSYSGTYTSGKSIQMMLNKTKDSTSGISAGRVVGTWYDTKPYLHMDTVLEISGPTDNWYVNFRQDSGATTGSTTNKHQLSFTVMRIK